MEIRINFEGNKTNTRLYFIYGVKYKELKFVINDSFRVPNHFYLNGSSLYIGNTDEYEFLTKDGGLLVFDVKKIKNDIISGKIKIERNILGMQYINIPIEKDFDKIIEEYTLNV